MRSFHAFESWVKAMAGRRLPGWLTLTAQSFDNFGRRELAIEESRATPGQAPLAQTDGAIYLTLAPDAV
ncbi:hypothetical protein HUN39_07210 [Methylocystis sp. FS]|uniref:hypothetical protein n=1 Tax=Methylocystis silviterrae TaxID=2743612 RepID=UPI0015844718|nr:hypothetical protein [Methylocystis silviterrae]NUJ79820.1 hypothetical protein [Methylocystis silviterrae]